MQSSTHHVFDPLVRLTLGVNEERPASREFDDDTVLYRQVVLGQPADLPAADFDWITHGGDEIGVLRAWHFVLVQLRHPVLRHVLTVLPLNTAHSHFCFVQLIHPVEQLHTML